MQSSPVSFVLCFTFTFCMVLAKINQLIEAPMQRLPKNPFDHYNFTNCIYQMLIVMTTVGYGDISNSTLAGKLLIFISAIFGVIVVSFFVTVITKKLEMTPPDSRSFVLIKRLAARRQIEKKAAGVVKIFFKIMSLHRKGKLESMRKIAAELKIRLANLRLERRKYKTMIPEIQVNEDIFMQFERIQTSQKQALIAINNISKLVLARKPPAEDDPLVEEAYNEIMHKMMVPTTIQAEVTKQVQKARVDMHNRRN